MSLSRNAAEIENNNGSGIDDIFSYMCSLAVAKCAKKSEKKKASCGGAAMRKRLLIKNFVTQMLDQERQMSQSGREQLSREVTIPTTKRLSSNVAIVKPMPRTRLNEEDQMEEDNEEEEIMERAVEENQDSEELQTIDRPVSRRCRTPSLSDSEEEDQMEESEEERESDQEDSDDDSIDGDMLEEDALNNNTSYCPLSPASSPPPVLPAIGSLDMDVHRSFAPSYLVCDDDPTTTDLSDDDEAFELFTAKTLAISSADKAPSWHESETDLFMLERYYEDFAGATVPVSSADYGLAYCNDDFSPTTGSDLYTLGSSSVVDSPPASPFLISPADSEPPSPLILCSDSVDRHFNPMQAPPQLPKNFMEETEMIQPLSSSPILTALTTSYAELRSNDVIYDSGVSKDVHDVKEYTDLEAKDKAQNDDKEDEQKEVKGTKEQQQVISSAFVDLVNVVPSNKLNASDCRREALQEALNGARHITGLDSHDVQVTKLLPEFVDQWRLHGGRMPFTKADQSFGLHWELDVNGSNVTEAHQIVNLQFPSYF